MVESSTGDSSTEGGASPVPLPGHLLDEISEILAGADDAVGRAKIITELVAEIYETVAWLQGGHSPLELLSLSPVVAETRTHQRRVAGSMSVLARRRTEPIHAVIDDAVALAIMAA